MVFASKESKEGSGDKSQQLEEQEKGRHISLHCEHLQAAAQMQPRRNPWASLSCHP